MCRQTKGEQRFPACAKSTYAGAHSLVCCFVFVSLVSTGSVCRTTDGLFDVSSTTEVLFDVSRVRGECTSDGMFKLASTHTRE